MKESKQAARVLFIGKAGDRYSESAAQFVLEHFESPEVIFSRRSDPFPTALLKWNGDLLISYLSQWIIPAALLQQAKVAAINFHPGPPEYPGIGCTNFAIYNGEKIFGVTCHHMQARVDTGSIIAVKRFPILPEDSVYTITQQCYRQIAGLFLEMMDHFILQGTFPQSEESWTRKPFTRKQLNELCVLRPGMSDEEIQLRLRATTYGNEIWASVLAGDRLIPYAEAQKEGLI